MGNTVSAHIYEIKVFRPYPVILYRLILERPKLVHSMVRHLHMYDEMPI